MWLGESSVVLAPMEGVTDAPFRALAGEWGGFDYAVTEFYRVTHSVPSRRALLAHMPELATGSRTRSGLRVQLQLLGGDPAQLAATAELAVSLGALAIDLNFGCPAKTVNRHDGGATLLKHPDRLEAIVRAVRRAVPAAVPVSAKLRLGWSDATPLADNLKRVESAGASWATVHARTREAGYRPPVHWDIVGELAPKLAIPVIANGDIWTAGDAIECRRVTGSRHLMLGRGALARPGLAATVQARSSQTPEPTAADWVHQVRRLAAWSDELDGPDAAHRTLCRLKQWLNYAAKQGTFAHFDLAKRCRSLGELRAGLEAVTGPEAIARSC